MSWWLSISNMNNWIPGSQRLDGWRAKSIKCLSRFRISHIKNQFQIIEYHTQKGPNFTYTITCEAFICLHCTCNVNLQYKYTKSGKFKVLYTFKKSGKYCTFFLYKYVQHLPLFIYLRCKFILYYIM